MQTPRNGLGLSHSCSCTSKNCFQPKNRFYDQQITIGEKYLNESSRDRSNGDTFREIKILPPCSLYASSYQHRRRYHKISPTHSKISACNINGSERVKLSSEKQHFGQISNFTNLRLTGRACISGGTRFRWKNRHHIYFKSKRILLVPGSYTLKSSGLNNKMQVNKRCAETQNDYIKPNSSTEMPSQLLYQKAQHTPRLQDSNSCEITKKSAEPFGSNASVQFHISGSLSFDKKITQKPWTNTTEFSTYENNVAKGDKLTPNAPFVESEYSKRISRPLCYYSKAFSISTDLMNAANHTFGYKEQQLKKDRESFCAYSVQSDERQTLKLYSENPHLYNWNGKKYSYWNEVQIYYVFDKPFQRSTVPKIVPESAECSALCQTDAIKNTGGVMKRLYHKLLESNEIKDSPQGGPCGNTSILCQVDGIKNEGSFFRRHRPNLFEPNEYINSAHVIEQCGNTSVVCQAAGIDNEGSFFKRRKPNFLLSNGHRKNMSEDAAEKCANPSTHCQAGGIKNENNGFKRLFHTIIEPVECKCVSNKLSQINMKAPKLQCTCAEVETQSRRYRNMNFFNRRNPDRMQTSEFNDNIPHITRKCSNSSTLCQLNPKHENTTFKRLFHTVIEPVECKCVSNKLSQINMKAAKLACTCAEAETQSRRYGNIKYEQNFFNRRNDNILQTSELHENMPHVKQSCANSSTLCQIKAPKNENNSLKRLFHILIDSHDCGCVANKLRQIIPLINITKPECTCAEANTQSRKYVGSYQRAGRESFYRDTGTSGFPKYTPKVDNPESQEVPMEDMEYRNSEDLYYVSDKPATTNRRVGANGGYNMKCCHNVPQDTVKCTNSSSFCQLDGSNNGGGVFKRLCHILLEPKHMTQVNHKCVNSSILCRLDGIDNEIDFIENMKQFAPRCTNSSSLCHIEGAKNKGGYKKLFRVLLEAKNMMPQVAQRCCKTRGTLCQVGGVDYEDNAFKRLLQVLFEPNESKGKANKLKQINPSITVLTEATTQSRKYGGQQQRAGKEIFRRNRGTSGVPKQRCKKVKKEEEPVYEVIDEYEEETCVEPECTSINREIGIGTNCNFTLGWFKDRLAYGEPKPQDTTNNTKIAIEQWKEAPLKKVQKVSTKIGACLKTNSTFNFINSNAGTQSRKYRKRDLRAGRETFYKERQTSCIPKCKKLPFDGNLNTIIVNQPIQPPAPDRKAVRLGSDCSFSFEFYRDVPPESPESAKSKANETQGNKNILSKFIRHRRADGKENKTDVTGKTDACTCTEVVSGVDSQNSTQQEQEEKSSNLKKSDAPKAKNKSQKEECRCENVKKKPLKPSQVSDRPFHMGSSVKFNFNFFKSISPPKGTNLLPVDDISTKEQCSCGVLTNESGITSSRQERDENKRISSISSECDPNICDNTKPYDIDSNISSPDVGDIPQADLAKTTKKCLLEFMSKKNLKRLINGIEKKPKVKKQLSQNIRYRGKPESVCEAKCKSMGEEPPEPDKPFRIGSSFSFGYDMKNVVPKHEEVYEENFPQPEDFSGSQLKTDLFRLIMGKIRKRIRTKAYIKPIESHMTSACDPRECQKRKEMNKTWFTYILDNIRQQKHVSSSAEEETKKFFSGILSGTTSKSNRCKRRHTCCRRKQKDSGWFSYILSNIRQERKSIPEIKTDAEQFFTEMLSETDHFRSCNCRGRSRRRRRRKQMPYGEYRAQFSAPNKFIDSDLSEWTPRSRSRTTEKERTPCRVKSECCFNCDYNKLDDSETDSHSTNSVSDSMNYATT